MDYSVRRGVQEQIDEQDHNTDRDLRIISTHGKVQKSKPSRTERDFPEPHINHRFGEGPLEGLSLSWNEDRRTWILEYSPTGLILSVSRFYPEEIWSKFQEIQRDWCRAHFTERPLEEQFRLEQNWKEDLRRLNFWEMVRGMPNARHHSRLRLSFTDGELKQYRRARKKNPQANIPVDL